MQLSLENFSFDPEADKIGWGGFGTVFKAKTVGLPNFPDIVALKQVKNAKPAKILNECEISKSLNHQYIVKFYGSFKDTNGQYYIVMEYCQYGDLRSYVKNRNKLSCVVAAKIVRQLVCALLHCHRKDVMHRDLSAGNILISRLPDEPDDPNSYPTIKIADFGLAREVQGSKPAMTFAGTPGYIAHEMKKGSSYTVATDIFALGSLLYFMLTGKEPTGSGELDLRSLPQDASDLIKELHADECDRISLNEIIKTNFMVENDATSLQGINSIESRSRILSTSQRRDTSHSRDIIQRKKVSSGLADQQRGRFENRIQDRGSRGQNSSRGGDSGFRSSRTGSLPPTIKETIYYKSVANGFTVEWPVNIGRLLKTSPKKEQCTQDWRMIATEKLVIWERGTKTQRATIVSLIMQITLTPYQKVEFFKPQKTNEAIPKEGDAIIQVQRGALRTYYNLTELEANDDDKKLYLSACRILWQMGHDITRVSIFHPSFSWGYCRLMENGDLRIVPKKQFPGHDKYIRKKANNMFVYNFVPDTPNPNSRPINDVNIRNMMDEVYRYLLQFEEVAIKCGMDFPLHVNSRQSEGSNSFVTTRPSIVSYIPASTASAPPTLRNNNNLKAPVRRELLVEKDLNVQNRYSWKQIIEGKPCFLITDKKDNRSLRMSTASGTPNIVIFRRSQNERNNEEQRFDYTKSADIPRDAEDLVAQLKMRISKFQ